MSVSVKLVGTIITRVPILLSMQCTVLDSKVRQSEVRWSTSEVVQPGLFGSLVLDAGQVFPPVV